ncbi:MAG: TIGR00730 family Rossman fold protein [Pseudomonadota bacterium]
MHSICLYCGSRPGARPVYVETARAFGSALAAAGYRLVYGGGEVGLMGEAATAAMAAGGHVTGIIPQHIVDLEIKKGDVSALFVTETMHERKKLMLYNADAVVALPGGPGTLDELIEVLTWRQLGLHGKPVVLVNANGYWDPLLALFRHIETEGFVEPNVRGYMTVVPDAEAAIGALRGLIEAR